MGICDYNSYIFTAEDVVAAELCGENKVIKDEKIKKSIRLEKSNFLLNQKIDSFDKSIRIDFF